MDDLRLNQQSQPSCPPLILIVDDDNTNRLLLSKLLENEGYSLAEAEDGAQALSAFDRLQPDLVLLDAMMPLVDGFTTCAALRKRPGGARLPVLMVTALRDDEAVSRAFEAGATDYVLKPIHQAVLRHKVRQLLQEKAEG